MIDITQKLLLNYAQKQTGGETPEISETDAQKQSYIKAAAVLHCFFPDELNPLNPNLRHPNPRLLLFDEIIRSVGEHAGTMFTLKLDARREALKKLANRRKMSEVLAVNPSRPLTPLQKVWEDYLLTGLIPNPETLGYQELTILCQIASWLDGLDKNFPDQTHLMNLARRRSVFANFEHLVISNFTGRFDELAMIREHLGLSPKPEPPALEKFFDKVNENFVNAKKYWPKYILSIHGPGGIGKSALVGRILWEQMQTDFGISLPFVYLAFDQPTLRIESPFTLLVEAAAQLELQFPEHKDSVALFQSHLRRFRDSRNNLGTRKEIKSSRKDRLVEVLKFDHDLYYRFAKLLRVIGSAKINKRKMQIPVLMILDTFEEVQYRDRESLFGLWKMLDAIHEEYPLLRVIISGRIALSALGIQKKNMTEVELAELSFEDRVLLLQRLGVENRETAENVAGQIGGNPLSLRLAANLITSDPDILDMQGIKDMSHESLSFKIDEELIQGQLYRRILDHIHNEDVRKLAHPGMILRRVDPKVIFHVLAPHCGISVSNIQQAKKLFNELEREHSLVQPGENGVLVYRPEIRRGMIRLLKQDKFAEVRQIHRAAVAFYETQNGISARAEEIYHRLVLGEDDPWLLDSRWVSGIESSIAAGVEEYPDQAKAWLASRMQLEVPREVFLKADVQEWERNVYRKVQKALSSLQINRVLQLLGERPERSENSPLFALEAKTYILQKNFEKAREVLIRGIRSVTESSNRGRLAELYWLESQVELLQNDPEKADEKLKKAGFAIKNSANPLPLVHIVCHRLLIRQRSDRNFSETAADLRLRLSRACERLDETQIYSATFVIYLAIGLLANEFPETSARLAKFVNYEFPLDDYDLSSENLQGLNEYREPWELETNLSPEQAV